MSKLLEVEQLGFSRANNYLLRNISFFLKTGEIFGVTGHSGSGKSTLLRLLCRLEEPSLGKIIFADQNISELKPQRLRRLVTLVFQNPTLLCPTVAEELRLGLTFQDAAKTPLFPLSSSEWVADLLRRVHLDPQLQKENPKCLSVGEAQRVALARALAIQPKVLLLDEPTSALDQRSKEVIEETLMDIAKSGVSIVLVSHESRQLKNLAVHGLELSKGEIINRW